MMELFHQHFAKQFAVSKIQGTKMKNFIIALIAITLVGCASDKNIVRPEPVVVKKIEYIVKIPPAELMVQPAKVQKIDVDAAKQSDVARWLLANEERMRALENQLREIAIFFSAEQTKADKDAADKNKAALQETLNK